MMYRRKRASEILTVLLLLLAVAGCDSYSLLAQFSRSSDLSLVLQRSNVKPGETIELYPSGGEEPYSFGVIADELFDDGVNSLDPGSIDGQSYTAGVSIGSGKVRLTDTTGNSVESIFTVLPFPPQNLSVDGAFGGPADVLLTWEYNVPGNINGFRVLRSVSGQLFEEVALLNRNARSFVDDKASPQENIYRLYAVAGEYESIFIEERGAGNP